MNHNRDANSYRQFLHTHTLIFLAHTFSVRSIFAQAKSKRESWLHHQSRGRSTTAGALSPDPRPPRGRRRSGEQGACLERKYRKSMARQLRCSDTEWSRWSGRARNSSRHPAGYADTLSTTTRQGRAQQLETRTTNREVSPLMLHVEPNKRLLSIICLKSLALNTKVMIHLPNPTVCKSHLFAGNLH